MSLSFPRRSLFGAAAASVALAGILAFVSATLFADVHRLLPAELRLRALADRVRLLDELSTTETLMAVTTGEWEHIARHQEIEDEMDDAFAQVLALAPGIAHEAAYALAVQSDAELDAIDRDAFELVRIGERTVARAVVVGDAYQTAARRNDVAHAALTEAIAARADQRFHAQQVRIAVASAAAAAAFALLVALGVHIARVLRRYVRALETSNRTLEERVVERTAQLVRAEKRTAIDRLAAGIAHELNTPAGVIAANLEYVRAECARASSTDAASAELESAVADSEDALRRMSAIINAMKRFASEGRGEPEILSLGEVLDTVAIVARHEYASDAVLDVDVAPELRVGAVRDDVQHVVLGLVKNAAWAIRETGHVGTIEVRGHADDGFAVVRVRDDGVGIAPEHLCRVFDPFFTTKPVGAGTGNGLAIAQTVVDQMGGSIGVTSTVGVGTTFEVRLPLVAPFNVLDLAEHAHERHPMRMAA